MKDVRKTRRDDALNTEKGVADSKRSSICRHDEEDDRSSAWGRWSLEPQWKIEKSRQFHLIQSCIYSPAPMIYMMIWICGSNAAMLCYLVCYSTFQCHKMMDIWCCFYQHEAGKSSRSHVAGSVTSSLFLAPQHTYDATSYIYLSYLPEIYSGDSKLHFTSVSPYASTILFATASPLQ